MGTLACENDNLQISVITSTKWYIFSVYNTCHQAQQLHSSSLECGCSSGAVMHFTAHLPGNQSDISQCGLAHNVGAAAFIACDILIVMPHIAGVVVFRSLSSFC